MTTDEIRAELRRSATEDRAPIVGAKIEAFQAAFDDWWSDKDCFVAFTPDVERTFYLLVAEALE